MSGDVTADQKESWQVVEFTLGDQSYCVSIDHVWELVKLDDLTAVPSAGAHVAGVMDLRGTTTTVLDLATVLELDNETTPRRVIVFEDSNSGQGDLGWAVDAVHEVRTINEASIDRGVDNQYIKGMVNQDGEFTIWLDPAMINAL